MIEKDYLNNIRDNYRLEDIKTIYDQAFDFWSHHLMSPDIMTFWGDMIDDIRQIIPRQK